jgi:prepilin-type N-terminal cleavage/methylation domain-containing protein
VRQSRRGFTLIELLVVIGIIMLLVAILAYSFRSLNRTAANNETKAELKVCKGMLAEYEGRNQLQGIEWVSPGGKGQLDRGAPKGTPQLFPVYVEPDIFPPNDPNEYKLTYGNAAPYWGTVVPDDISVAGTPPNGDMGDKASGPRYGNAVKNTLDVMYVLMRIPANQTLLQGIQTKRLLEPLPGVTQQNTVQQGNVLLDGWGNPIIFVPRGGLHTNALVFDPTQQKMVPKPVLVRSTGTITLTSGGQDPPLTGNERPFFASAGQDGDFTQGEDNVYSFQE